MKIAAQSLFSNPDYNAAQFETDMALPLPRRKLMILFTPRSGSSWLTDIVTRSKQLGKPREWFNPNFIPNINRAMNANSRDGYIAMLMRKHALGNVFSAEVTIYQMQRSFESEETFLQFFPARLPYVWLRRKDLVLQAVSLAKAVQTQVFHAPQASPEDLVRAEHSFTYDPAEIDRWLVHILDQERLGAAFFERHQITPLQLDYETMMDQGAEATLRALLAHVRPRRPELPASVQKRLKSKHEKIGSDQNHDYAERYARSSPARMDEIAAFRAAHPV
ncbi:MAG: Stf0 family sulfotransferase [Roseinatronobacter sp.]